MTKKDLRRHNKIKEELAQLDQDFEDVLEEIRFYYVERNMKKIKVAETKLKWVLREVNLRRTIDEEITLPKYVKMTWVGEEEDMPKDAEMEEYIAMFLTDNYNHNVYGFQWVVKGKDVFITSIRWNQWQILESDLKRCLKDCNVCVKNGEVEIYKDPSKKGVLLIKDIESKYVRAAKLKEAIKELEDNYYM